MCVIIVMYTILRNVMFEHVHVFVWFGKGLKEDINP